MSACKYETLKAKIHELECLAMNKDFDRIGITETWWNDQNKSTGYCNTWLRITPEKQRGGAVVLELKDPTDSSKIKIQVKRATQLTLYWYESQAVRM